MNLWRELKGEVRLGEPLKKHTTFKIGGPARLLIRPADEADLKLALASARKIRMPVLILGAGSNILASDRPIKAVVIKLDKPFFKTTSFKGNLLYAGGASLVSRLAIMAKSHGLGGLEFLAGIPGTLGGALMMNAGAWGKEIGDLVESVSVMDYNGRKRELTRRQVGFRYRGSNLGKYIILGAALKLAARDKQKIQRQTREYILLRRHSQDLSLPNAGCVFKNPPGAAAAGRLIDLCGLKGLRHKGAGISMRHANFILNYGNARFADVVSLMSLIKKRVRERFGLELEAEIKIWK